MTRAVLVGWSEVDWRLYRQPQWMAEVRRSPNATLLPRRHFDMEDAAFGVALEVWERESTGASLESALELLNQLGGSEVIGP